MQPWRIFTALVLLNILLGVMVWIFPDNGLIISKDITLRFVSKQELWDNQSDTTVNIESVLKGLALSNENEEIEQKTFNSDRISPVIKTKTTTRNGRFSRFFTFPKNNQHMISLLLEKINHESKNKVVRILHYGDSQLEGDRITSYIRNRFQNKFGGIGPGILLPLEPAATYRENYLVTQSKNFIKHAFYKRNSDTKHIGISGSAYIYNHDSTEREPQSTYIQINKKNRGYLSSRSYSRVSLLYSSNRSNRINILINDTTLLHTLPSTGSFGVKKWNVNSPQKLKFDFLSKERPTIYGIALDGDCGIAVDNFPMRGSNGIGFQAINQNLYVNQLKELNVVAVVLQYGVNIIPNESKSYHYYYKKLSQQLKVIKAADPSMVVIVIGPSDMSKNINGNMVSYDNIPLIVDAMKKAAIENDCCFWDLYRAMGGKNAMVAWVNDGLAQKDFTHFSYKGAKYVGEMFCQALLELEYK